MTTTLKTTGVATNCTLCLMVNPETNLLQDFASAAVTSTLTVDAGVTISAGTWNGAARSYAQLGTNVNFIGFGANKPQVKLNGTTNQELTVVGIFETASFGTKVFGPDASNFFGTNIQSSPSPAIKYYLTPPTSGSGANFAAGEKWLFGFSCVSDASTTVYKAKHDAASVFTEAATSILPGSPGALSWVLDWVGRRTDSTAQQADKLYAVLVFNKSLTAAEWDTLRVDWRGTLLSTTADTTPPTLTGTVTVSAITTTTATLAWPAGADNVAVTSYETSLDGTTWTDRGNVLTIGLTGLTAGTAYTARVRAKDAAGNVSTPAITGAFTTTAAGDTTAPVLTGSITSSAITTTSYTLTWPAATDNVAVTGYEYSVNGGSTYTANGTALTVNVTGRAAGATDSVAVRAFDAAGNRSAALTTTVTLVAAGDTTAPTLTGAIAASAVTSTTYTLTGSAATDNVAVTGYEYSVNGGSTYTANGTALTVNVTGRTPGATDSVAWRAFDAAGNRSAALTTTVTLAAAAGGATVNSLPFKNSAGLPLVNTTIPKVALLRMSDMVNVLTLVNQVTSASGVLTVSNAALTAGVLYLMVTSDGTINNYGAEPYTAA